MALDEYTLGIEDISAIVIVMLISAGIGVYFRFSGGRQKTTTEFLMAGRTMSPLPVVFSLIVTFVSAVMMLGIPSEVYEFGIYRLLAYVCGTISNVLSAYIFLPVYFQMGDSVSVYEYLERRFGALTRKIASVSFIFHSLFFMSVVLVAPALALSTVCDINIDVSIISIGAVCTIYCCMGGMKAVLWTDVFQAIVMYTCVFAIMIKGVLLAGTSIPETFRSLHSKDRKFFSFDPTVRYTLWNCVSYGFLYGLYNYGCNQAQIQRMLSVKSLKLSQWAVIASVPLGIVFTAINFFLGIIMHANYHGKGLVGTSIKKKDQLIPYFITRSFMDYPGLAGLCIAGIFSGSLSTISSSVNSLAAVTMEDFVRPCFSGRRKIKDSTAAILVAVFACAYGIAGMILAFAMKGNEITYAYTVVFGITSGPILGLFTLGMMTVIVNQKGALYGLVSGLVATLALGIVLLNRSNSSCNESCQKVSNITSELNSFNRTINMSSTLPDIIIPTTTEDDIISSLDTVTTTTNCSMSATGFFNDTTEISTSDTQNCSCPYPKSKLPSIMWLISIGFALTTTVGYLSSLIEKRSGNQAEPFNVDPALLSPLVKKWVFKSLPQTPPSCSEELVKLNGHVESP